LPPEPPFDQDDPWRFGWRYVQRRQADGTKAIEQLPLSYEDLLYPKAGDFVPNGSVHLTDRHYLSSTLAWVYRDDPAAAVLTHGRIDWGVKGLRPGRPDIVVLFGVHEWRQGDTFHVADEGGTPVLVIEITSPITRALDVGPKLQLYHRAGVQRYVIVDRRQDWTGAARLLAFQRGPEGWVKQTRDAKRRLSLAPIPLAIGVKGGRPWLYDPTTGDRFLSHDEMVALKKIREATARAEAETERHIAARKRAEAQIRSDRAACVRLRKSIRELEKQLRRRKGKS
jgi:Uma2 family endonuclease